MRPPIVCVVAVLFGALAVWSPPAEAVSVYFNDFQTAVGPELATSGPSPLGIDTTPTGRSFLGRTDGLPTLGLGSETVTLTLGGLAAHSDVTVTLKLFIIQSWDGNGPFGPDFWRAGFDGSLTNLQNTTFANVNAPTDNQCFPANCPATNPPRTGARESNSLGYTFFGDSVYDLAYTFTHTDSTLILKFTAAIGQNLTDESWGIDNLRVEITPTDGAVPEPGTLLLLGTGLASLAASRFRRRRRGRRLK